MRPSLRSALLAGSVFTALFVVVPALEAQQDTTTRPAARRRGDRTRLMAADLAGSGNITTALDAIRILRPQWLNPPMGRVASSNLASESSAAMRVVVYIDGMRQPDVESSLVTIKAADVVEMRYFDQNRAVQEMGPGHEAGVIQVTTTFKKKP